ncbi:hypothetical protein [Propionivibrio limicola]|uniref:hypothetical protein n=1 Tax=Propionivibrio limicola TaxID=167645 RepID=UPI001290D514|nr:hypothetical protein [Propionivibrio limicola]
MNTNFDREFERLAGPPKSPLAQLFAALIGLVVLGLAFMFSLVVFAIVAVVGVFLWLYFWWKTRALRKQIQAQMADAQTAWQQKPTFDASSGKEELPGAIIDGESTRVDEPGDRSPGRD